MHELLTVEIVVDEHDDRTALVTLTGELDATSAPVLQERLGRLDASVERVRVDASQLRFFGAAGVRCIVALEQRLGGTGHVVVERPRRITSVVLEAYGLGRLSDQAGR